MRLYVTGGSSANESDVVSTIGSGCGWPPCQWPMVDGGQAAEGARGAEELECVRL